MTVILRHLLVPIELFYLAGLNTACSRKDRQFRPLIEARVQRELYEVLLEWIEDSRQKPDNRNAGLQVTASVMSWAIFGVALDWSRDGSELSPEEVADKALAVIIEGHKV